MLSSLSRIVLTSAAVAVLVPMPAAAQDAEVVMRRPLPGKASSGGVDPDGGETGSDRIFVAGVQCGPDSKYRVTCFEVDENGDDPFRLASNPEECTWQDSSAPDYLYYSQYMTEEMGMTLASPSQAYDLPGSDCEEEEAAQVLPAVACRQSLNGSWYGSCYDVTMVPTVTGNFFVKSMSYNANGSSCFQTGDFQQSSSYQSMVNSLGMFPAGIDGTDHPECVGDNADAIYLARGQCQNRSYHKPDGTLVIETGFKMECFKARATPGGDSPWAISMAPISKCENPDNTPAERQIIAEQFSPEYKDPATIDTGSGACGVEFLDYPKVERQDTPRSTQFLGNEEIFLKLGAYQYRFTPVEEKYTFYCHRYKFDIFEGALVYPGILNDSTYVAEPNAREGVTGWGYDCAEEARLKAEELRAQYADKPDVCLQEYGNYRLNAEAFKEEMGYYPEGHLTIEQFGAATGSCQTVVEVQNSGPTDRAGTIRVKFWETETNYVG